MADSPEKKRQKRASNPKKFQEQYRKWNLKKFGLTPEQYDEMFLNQKGLCAICERHSSNFKRRLAVDHCHHTGKVRGLLCASCNSGLGKLQDDVDYLQSAILYLERTNG